MYMPLLSLKFRVPTSLVVSLSPKSINTKYSICMMLALWNWNKLGLFSCFFFFLCLSPKYVSTNYSVYMMWILWCWIINWVFLPLPPSLFLCFLSPKYINANDSVCVMLFLWKLIINLGLFSCFSLSLYLCHKCINTNEPVCMMLALRNWITNCVDHFWFSVFDLFFNWFLYNLKDINLIHFLASGPFILL